MDRQDSWRPLAGRVWLVALIPLLAGGLAVAVAADRPREREAAVTVVGRPPALEAGPVTQYVAAYQATLRSQDVVSAVARQTGLTERRVRRGLTVQQTTAAGATLEVTFRHPDPVLAERVATAAATRTLAALVEPARTASERRLTVLRAQAAELEEQSVVLVTEAGTPVPTEAYRSAAGRLTSLEVAFEQARAAGDSATAIASLRRAADGARAELTRLGALLARFPTLEAQRDRLAIDLQEAVIDQEVAAAAADDPAAGGTVLSAGTRQTPLLAFLAPVVAPVVVLASLLALGLALLLSRRRPAGRHVAAVTPEAAGPVPAPLSAEAAQPAPGDASLVPGLPDPVPSDARPSDPHPGPPPLSTGWPTIRPMPS